jgi:hypothetical protein
MSDFLDAGRHFSSPKFWLFEAESEFFNTGACLQQLRVPDC